RHAEARLAYEEIERIHPTAAQAPLTVLVEVRPDHEETLADLKWQLRSLDGVTDVFLTHMLEENSTVFGVQYEGHQTGETAQRLVAEIRAMEADFGILVGGPTAELVDAADALGAGVGWAILAVVLVTGMLLLRLTGSVVVSVKTIVLNLLSLAATLGVVVAVFQWGWGSSLLGFDP